MKEYSSKRKEMPIFSGVVKYFPDALKEVSKVSFIGNKQHNEGNELIWDKSKSTDHQDAMLRHLIDSLSEDKDLVMEQILENINTTPLGQVLKRIASLPEVRKEKILDVRRQLTKGDYNLNDRLELVLDRVLEDLTA